MKSKLKILVTLATISAALAYVIGGPASGAIAQERPVDFSRDVHPILSDNCFSCHGPDENKRMMGLRLDTQEGITKSRVVVSGKRSESKLYQRVSAQDPARRMPPVSSGHSLTPAQIELIGKWIDQGAKWSSHWAFEPIKNPELPSVKNANWIRNPIDRFILARLEREGLSPSSEADKVTLFRRVALDLTGLPPTPAEIDAFLADSSPDAYEKQVDRLLGSEHYGERMAMPWLDLARYADTHGYHIDSHRDMWPWRDWVINAFNRNMRFDQFTIEQLAGDLVPKATRDQIIASGFNRNHMINFEGGAIPEEYLVEYVVDRVEATSTTWLGLTMGCARCHSHKYDPISQKEFYQFFAFFNTVSDEGLDGRTGNAKPYLELPTDEQKTQMDKLNAAIKDLEGRLDNKIVGPMQSEWEATVAANAPEYPRAGLENYFALDGSFVDLSGQRRDGRLVRGDPSFSAGVIGRGVAFDGDSEVSFGSVPEFDSSKTFSIAFWIKGGGNQPASVLQKIDNAETRRGYEFYVFDRSLIGIQKFSQYLAFRITDRWPESAIEIRTQNRIAMSDWYHIVVTGDGSGSAKGLRLYVNGKREDAVVLKDSLKTQVRSAAKLLTGNRDLGKPFRGSLDDLRLYSRSLNDQECEQLAIHYPVQSIISGTYGKPTRDDAARVRDYFLTRIASRELADASASLKALKKEKDDLNKRILSVMVMDEAKRPRETSILARGDYRNAGEKVTPDVPRVLPALASTKSTSSKPNRLTLARWLVDPNHPLTSRVAMNRYWQMYFGQGIVKTVEDFGSQGEPPTHPELLDWLASEFIRSGWDIKAMQRLIVTSSTYRQSSRTSPALHEKDPDNRLYARGPRHRLQAESVRDLTLAASGLLNNRVGGPSVLPYQPPGIWEELAFGDGFSAQEYHQSKGADLYRRSMYTFWKRTAPPASLAVFDAPDREKCTARRPVTNTPLQALVLMNDPTYVEAARALAARTLKDGGKTDDVKLQYAFRLATARLPAKEELTVLRDLLIKERRGFARDVKSAGALLNVGDSKAETGSAGELAAWTIVASAILNLDETITNE